MLGGIFFLSPIFFRLLYSVFLQDLMFTNLPNTYKMTRVSQIISQLTQPPHILNDKSLIADVDFTDEQGKPWIVLVFSELRSSCRLYLNQYTEVASSLFLTEILKAIFSPSRKFACCNIWHSAWGLLSAKLYYLQLGNFADYLSAMKRDR